jgi:CubicO group peptidase (beta-lactamase class C family)
MNRSTFLFAALLTCAVAVASQSASRGATVTSSLKAALNLTAILERIRVKYALPSIAAVAVRDGAVVGVAAVGERALGSSVGVTVNDAYHLGSMSKSFTATVLGKLVELGKIRWDLRLETAFPDVQMRPEFRSVTLEMLLTHRAGFSANVEDRTIYAGSSDWAAIRQRYLIAALTTAPAYPPGQIVAYGNTGYVIASLMAERSSGMGWQALVRQYVYQPLEMQSCTFGTTFPPLSNPHPHRWDGLTAVPLEPQVENGNPPALDGADNVRCSLPDLGKYLVAHLSGERGADGILQAATFKELHRPRVNGGQGIYMALGWLVFSNGELWYNGSNTLNYSEMALYQQQNLAVAVATNAPVELNQGVQQAMEEIYLALER